ncbi:2-succinyl-5-enolpyruvyl-6-hydroxy-3-cyclohexene-1-carboxylic-acid synthase [Arthrobacter sp. MYb227]|uniref:2-succinyl-5-enolpyruvyl-6-hydroxy-3- cyclohexene-1-carboxylic-acid synthase n=1 Tax=Arthrobacter sp. MYb227 TaxID=1848601 RepID=UPI000CFE32D9|nr:2-succinyl-5-enolpyruvyl-6-hydroxy-3-cyclohexene-1-carboxylic-acid synthase [Arthrobacter sp. MYb227]PQZ96200.1 2-succinyl-5-enolpyruvyl-6-hydroxy-3-cyclohexene-1-carboxylic-acid synthase [Arthrobacter sp. MYb227]
MPANSAPSLTSMDAARKLVSTLQTSGVRDVVICPGSRSAPLAYALAEAEAVGMMRLHVRIDERAAGFTALGLSLASGVPVPVLTTSGTAVGELLPAVMEANHAGVQLVVLSADRPIELHGTGANQTTSQFALFGTHVRASVNISVGIDPSKYAQRALHEASGSQFIAPGPVQINVAFRDPLIPADEDSLPDFGTNVSYPAVARETPSTIRWDVPVGVKIRQTVVVAGHGAGAEASEFAHALGLPLFAEPSSNARHGANVIAAYRTLITKHMNRIERVVLFGRPTLSRPVAKLLGNAAIKVALWNPTPASWFEKGKRTETLIDSATELSSFAGVGPSGWLEAWQTLDAQATKIIDHAIEASGELNGPLIAQTVWKRAVGNLVFGSSNVIRDADLCAVPGAAARSKVFANRGLAGIDGTVATATGIAQVRPGIKTTVLLGDVTFLHDVGSMLLGAGEPEPDLDVIVLNDRGGAIFSTLEHGAVEASGRYANTVERLFATPHDVRLGPLAAAYGWEYVAVGNLAELNHTLVAKASRRRLIEVVVTRNELRSLHQDIAQSVNSLDWPVAE